MMEDNSIKQLFTTSGPFDKKEAIDALRPLISIMENTNQIFITKQDMKVADKILAFAITKKLLQLEGIVPESHISAIEVYENTHVAKGSIDTSFRQLKEERYLIGEGKKYEIPNNRIPEVIARLKNIIKT